MRGWVNVLGQLGPVVVWLVPASGFAAFRLISLGAGSTCREASGAHLHVYCSECHGG
jgi:hypothetical protein